ncbi:hypothetical protein [Roseomonas chloroacetimidivorans]|uniref:hypothetical protein n=1 Tax=Roseomonas chloroacetimidivorans TaxID=1766656 RepID=UPI003C752EB0
MKIINPTIDLLGDDELEAINHSQWIDPGFLAQLHEERSLASQQRFGEMGKVASIPNIFVEKWLREGFDVYRENPKAIQKKLISEGLEHFLATNKRF